MGYYYYLSSNERTERAMRSDARVVSTLRWPLIVIFIRAELFQKMESETEQSLLY